METSIPEISNQVYKEDFIKVLEDQYSTLGPIWTNSQLQWANDVYKAFKNHDKFLIIIYLIKKTLDFYSKNFTLLNYDEFYSKSSVEIGRYTISEISKNLKIPKESARRKVVELEKSGVIKKVKKKIYVDRSAYPSVKPINTIKRISRFLSSISKLLLSEKIISRKLSSEELEKIIEDNFSYIWNLYYEFQIPAMVSYKKFFKDLESYHIYGTCVVNLHLYKKEGFSNPVKRKDFLKSLYTEKFQGINAMSISDITAIPRATVIRKLKKMVQIKLLSIDSKKHYKITEESIKKLTPFQTTNLLGLADFSSKVFNLIIASQEKNNNTLQKNKNFEVPFYLKSF